MKEINFEYFDVRKEFFNNFTRNGTEQEKILPATRTIFEKLFYDEFFKDPFLKNLCRPKIHIPDGNEFTTFNVYSESKIKKAHIKPEYKFGEIIISGISIDSCGGDYYQILDSEILKKIKIITRLYSKYFISNFELILNTDLKYAGLKRDGIISFNPLTKIINKPIKINDLENFISDINNNGGYPNLWIFHWKLSRLGIKTSSICNMPIFTADDMADNIIMAIDLHENEYIFEEWRPLSVEPLCKVDDNIRFQISIGLLFVLKNIHKSGILIIE